MTEYERDEKLFDEAVAIAKEGRGVTASLLQRRLSIGYGRAAKLIERLAEEGYDISVHIDGIPILEGFELAPLPKVDIRGENVDPIDLYREVYENIYELCMFFKARIFEGDLPPFVLTLNPSSSRSITYGWCWYNIWADNATKQRYCEIAICSQFLSRPFEETASTVLHELVHLYCNAKGIKDTSGNGKYHNKTYKEWAQKFGLIVENTGSYRGWTHTTLSDSTKELLKEFKARRIDILCDNRGTGKKTAAKKPQKRKSTFACPSCGQSITSKNQPDIICGKCHVKFEHEED